jgi:galactose mutarotase-like enzyme
MTILLAILTAIFHFLFLMINEYILRYANIEAAVSPERGAIITRLRVHEREIFYLDRATFDDPTKNVRGGVPILFPFAGRLVNDHFVSAGTRIGQHGFARNKPWEATDISKAAIRCTLKSDAGTMAVFPYEFELEQTCLIAGEGLQIELQISNLNAEVMPVAPGWHPYFVCPADGKRAIATSIHGVQADRFTNDTEFDFGVTAPRNGRADFTIPELGKLQLSFSPSMRFLQFWSLPQKNFVCIEPFAGHPNILNSNETPTIAPGKTETYWMRIQVE